MRNFKVLFLSLVVFCSSALAGPKEDALQVVERWAKAFTEADVDTIVSLYAPDAVFIGTGSKAIVTKPEDIKKYFQGVLGAGDSSRRLWNPWRPLRPRLPSLSLRWTSLQ